MESQWLLNEQMVKDITPFSSYLRPFGKYKDVIVRAMDFFVGEFGGEEEREEENGFECYEDVINALESAIADQWAEYGRFISEYIATKTHDKSRLVTAKGALVRTALTFAVKNLLLSLSEFAQCQLECPKYTLSETD